MHAWMSVVCGGCQQSCKDLGCRVDLEGILSFQQCKSSDLSPLPFVFVLGEGGLEGSRPKKGLIKSTRSRRRSRTASISLLLFILFRLDAVCFVLEVRRDTLKKFKVYGV